MAKKYKTKLLAVKNQDGTKSYIPALLGKSAYDFAKDAGYNGTVDEYSEKQAKEPITDEHIKTLINNVLLTKLQSIHHVGSIFVTYSDANPADILGFGTWERIKDKFLLASGDTYEAGTTGGEATHTLTKAELPSDESIISFHSAGTGTNVASVSGSFLAGTKNTNSYRNGGDAVNTGAQSIGSIHLRLGSDMAHNNMPPYETVYMWKRIK